MEFQLVKTSEFKFRTKLLKEYEMELPFAEHTEELRQRFFQLIYIFLFISGVIFTNVTVFVKILENPVQGIKFIQLSPGEYLISTIKITIYSGFLICIPLIICQLIFFMLPGLTKNEKKFFSSYYWNFFFIIWTRFRVFLLSSNSSRIEIFC